MADFWIGMDFSTWCATAFFFLLPFCYCPLWQLLHREYKSGYLIWSRRRFPRNAILRQSFRASFLSGGAVIVFSRIVNVIFVACTVPMRLPSVLEVIYNGVYGFKQAWWFFIRNSVLYILFHLFADFLALTRLPQFPWHFTNWKTEDRVLILPFLTLMVFHIFLSLLYRFIPFCLSPLDFLRAVNVFRMAQICGS